VSSEAVPQPDGLGGIIPDHLSGRIVVDHERIGRIAGLAGFTGKVAITATADEQASPEGNGVEHAAAAVGRTVLSALEFDATHPPFSLTHPAPDLTIQINNAELQRRSAARVAAGLDEVDAFITELNHAIRSSLVRAAWRLNMRKPQPGEILVSAAMTGITVASLSMFNALPPVNYVMPRVLYAAYGLLPKKMRKTDICWLLFPVVHPDRFLLAYLYSRLPIAKRRDSHDQA
jgi:hypothetical protein